MNQQTILQSNLLDIIFENRNKNYGAYELRVSYNRRMSVALISTTVTCIILCLLFITNTAKVLGKEKNIFVIPDKTITEFHPNKLAAGSVIRLPSKIKKRSAIEMLPKIEASVNINKLPATPPEISQSLKQVVLPGSNSPQPGDEYDPGRFTGTNEPHAILITGAKPKKNVVLNDADIMSEYPGGTNALLLFLKKNIKSPEDIEQGEERLVKIKFIVNYNGRIEGFDVIKSGGMAFDDEGLRVLKKMPLWKPGKSNGENVSVYYIVPVRFSSLF
ncbi:MAG: energy transducer TonB [Bacteroidota bacterium]|nr:energy transducer TonB [Bacteroidota bacterium]